MRLYFFVIIFIWSSHLLTITRAQSWSNSTYSDNAGFQQRMAPMLGRIATKGFAERGKATSKCPDTGLPVKNWAVKGEKIISPYTGRQYKQGPTGYFGPKERNARGEITAFGGDPLKYDLSPATARLLLEPDNMKARAFLSIPGNMRQQYHFACKNWARFYPLFAKKMGEKWKADFTGWVGRYSESRRPSDGDREHAPLSIAHNLVGEPGHLLGGNKKNGGTENHKTMWRTSALLYSQLFPDSAKISGYPVEEAEQLTSAMLRDYLKRLLVTGNGEYDSQVYYPHSIEAFMNLYDYSPDAETRQMAKFALDYYFASYGLKVIDGTIAGAQKRGYLAGSSPGEMETMLWGFFNNTSREMAGAVASIQQATTSYRPNSVISNIMNKNLKTPFEAKMSRPFYHMDHPHAFAETFYCSDSFAMGNIQMTIVDNPNQQMVWSLVSHGVDGPLCFSGGHPMRGSTSGHSPYTQTLHSKGTLVLLTAPSRKPGGNRDDTVPVLPKADRESQSLLSRREQHQNYEIRNRLKHAGNDLHPVEKPVNYSKEEIERFWDESKGSASSWFYFPRQLEAKSIDGNFYFEANNAFVAVLPVSDGGYVFAPPDSSLSSLSKQTGDFFRDYSIIVFPGKISGYIVEAVEKSEYNSLDGFHEAIVDKTMPDYSAVEEKLEINYYSLQGDNLRMQYRPYALRCKGTINADVQDWDNFTNGAVYESPYLSVKNGIMKVSDGEQGYSVDFTGDKPVFDAIESMNEMH